MTVQEEVRPTRRDAAAGRAADERRSDQRSTLAVASTNLAFPPCGHPSVALVARSSLPLPSLCHSAIDVSSSAPSPLGPSSPLDLPLPLPLHDRLELRRRATRGQHTTEGRDDEWHTRVEHSPRMRSSCSNAGGAANAPQQRQKDEGNWTKRKATTTLQRSTFGPTDWQI